MYIISAQNTLIVMRILFLLLPFFCFSQHSIFQDSLKIINLNSDKLSLKGIDNLSLELINLGDSNYMIDRLGGGVYILKGTGLKQIDNSYQHKMQIGSNIYPHNDTIFRHGGYGFWETRSSLTFYDFNSNEWDIVKSKNKGTSKYDHLSVTKNNKTIFFGGFINNESIRIDNNKSSSSISFDYKLREWSNFGIYKFHFSERDRLIDKGKDEKIILKKDTLFLVKPFENKVEFYRTNSFLNTVISNSNLKSFYKDSIFYFINKVHSKGQLQFTKRSYDEVFLNKIGESELIEKENYATLSLIISVFVSTVFFIYFIFYKKTNKPLLNIIIDDKTLLFQNTEIQLSNNELKILESFMVNRKIQLKDLIGFLNKTELNYNHQLRIINSIIKDLNNKLNIVLGLEDLFINTSKSELDKRIKIYTLNDTVKINFKNKQVF